MSSTKFYFNFIFIIFYKLSKITTFSIETKLYIIVAKLFPHRIKMLHLVLHKIAKKRRKAEGEKTK